MAPALPLSALRAFEAAARTGSFRAASGELALTPSAVSHAIRRLESDLGVTLFRRGHRAIALTGEGEALMRAASKGFIELRRGLAAVSVRGPRLLRLHCAPSLAAQWLTPRLSRLLAECPGIEMRLAANADYGRFHADDFDADIVYGTPRQLAAGTPSNHGLVIVPLGKETVTPLCAPALAPRVQSLADLRRQILIESDNKLVRWSDWFRANGQTAPPPQGLRFDRSFIAIAGAVTGLGVALESTRLAEQELADGRLVRPLAGRVHDISYDAHHLVYPARTENRAVKMFSAWLGRELGLDLSAPDAEAH